MSEIVNCKISSTILGLEDHGIFTAYLYLEWSGAGIAFGGYTLDGYDKAKDKRIDKLGMGLEYIRAVMETVGVSKWEDLSGKFIRLDTEGWGGRALGIGNLIEDKWFYPKEFFKQYE
jgi:hypothetical protein